jgi:hypothetical protein
VLAVIKKAIQLVALAEQLAVTEPVEIAFTAPAEPLAAMKQAK